MRDLYEETRVMRSELFFFLAGITIGVAAALLIAPYSGEEIRQLIRDRVDEGRDRASEMLEKGREFVGRGRDSISEASNYPRRTLQEKI